MTGFYTLLTCNKANAPAEDWRCNYFASSNTEARQLSARYATDNPLREVYAILYWSALTGVRMAEEDDLSEALSSEDEANPAIRFAILGHVHYWLAKAIAVAIGRE